MPSPILITPQLLSHPWYQKWECGALPAESIQHYASQYYWQVAQFPRYLSRLHSQMDDLAQRQVILGNLVDEENSESPHPELWLDFAEAMGLDRNEIRAGTPGPAVRELVEEFKALVSSSPAEGLGAILAYESQIPEVARFKAKALKHFYLNGENAEKGARFFTVHEAADVWHTEELEKIVATLSAEDQRTAQAAAKRACAALWNFLDSMPS